MKGSIVKKSIKVADWKIGEVAEKIGLSREHLGRLLLSEIDDAYVEKIKNLGIEILNETKSDFSASGNFPSEKVLHDVIRSLNEMISMLSKNNEELKKDKEELRKDKQYILENNNIYQSIVKKAVDDGKLKIEGKLHM